MADIPETVLLSQAVCIGLTQPYSLDGRSCWLLSYIATVPHMNLYFILDMLKMNFLPIPSMFTTIPHKTRSCRYRSPKFRLLDQIPTISPAERVHGWWEPNNKCHLFFLYNKSIGLWPMHYRTPSKECNYYVTWYTPQKNPQKLYGGKMWSQLSWLHRIWRQGLHRL